MPCEQKTEGIGVCGGGGVKDHDAKEWGQGKRSGGK